MISTTPKTFSATIRELEIIGEAVNNISDGIKPNYSHVLWIFIRFPDNPVYDSCHFIQIYGIERIAKVIKKNGGGQTIAFHSSQRRGSLLEPPPGADRIVEYR
jgi:hypothetical protein